ncbi:MAG TPA: hypothetical protein VNL14_13920 [Candidatus Acidoferrales bacterium]|nr:hypothetical protein [Candidatus Acidoferrales bacterium]
MRTERVVITGKVLVKNRDSIKLWTPVKDIWLGRRAVLDSDTEWDEIEQGEEITAEIPLWLARKEGLSE